MANKKRGQVTVFIIAGIMILAAFILVFFLVVRSKTGVMESSFIQAYGSSKVAFPVEKYVNTHLENALRQGIYLIGMQGGYIYESQGGPIPDPFTEGEDYILYGSYNVSYNILRLEQGSAPFEGIHGFKYSDPPEYPMIFFPYFSHPPTLSVAADGPFLFLGDFGLSNQPSLDDEQDPFSIKSQLEHYIENYLDENLDFSLFEEQGIDVSFLDKDVSVTIGERDVLAKLDFPLGVSYTLRAGQTDISEFYAIEGIRLRKVYNFAKDLIDSDNSNIRFDISDENSYLGWNSYEKARMKLEHDRNFYRNDDLFVISDSRSVIYAQPFKYQFARQNRPPALNYIYWTFKGFDELEAIIGSKFYYSDFSFLKAYDPDESPGVVFNINDHPDNFVIESISHGKRILQGTPLELNSNDFSRGYVEFRVTVYDEGGQHDPFALRDWQVFRVQIAGVAHSGWNFAD